MNPKLLIGVCVCVQGGASCSDEAAFSVWEFLGWGFISTAELP